MNAIVTAVDFQTRILIVDDDAAIRDLMAGFLVSHGYAADSVENAEAMRAALARQSYDLIVLDVMMPGEDGLTALRALQGKNGPPVIMLSAVGSDVDRIIGLEIGADDYLVKPCNPRELLARIRTILRRARPMSTDDPAEQGSLLSFARWRLDLVGRTVTDPDGRELALSDGEFRLLRVFVDRPRRVLSRDQLLDLSRGMNADSYDRAIDVQVSRLRRKLAEGDGGEALIRTVRNEGYMFMAPVAHQ